MYISVFVKKNPFVSDFNFHLKSANISAQEYAIGATSLFLKALKTGDFSLKRAICQSRSDDI